MKYIRYSCLPWHLPAGVIWVKRVRACTKLCNLHCIPVLSPAWLLWLAGSTDEGEGMDGAGKRSRQPLHEDQVWLIIMYSIRANCSEIPNLYHWARNERTTLAPSKDVKWQGRRVFACLLFVVVGSRVLLIAGTKKQARLMSRDVNTRVRSRVRQSFSVASIYSCKLFL